MRIGFVTDNYRPYVSGVINFIALNRAYLERQGHEVWVFAFGDPDSTDGELRTVLTPGLKIAGRAGFRLGLRLSAEARRLIATMDVVHVDDPFVSGAIALKICEHHNIPVVFTNHSRIDLYPEYFLKPLPPRTVKTAFRPYLLRFCRRVDVVISPTASVADVLRDVGVDVPITVVRNGVDVSRFADASGGTGQRPGRVAGRHAAGIADDSVVFGYTGRLSPEKNLLLLLDAFARLKRGFALTDLLLIGDGPSRDALEEKAAELGLAESVHFTGMVPYARMPESLSMCDVWVSASVTEVDPLTVIEAMAAGLPVIGADSPGVSDTIVDGVSGLLASPDDAESLADKMTMLAHDPELRRRMADAGRLDSRQYAIEVTGAQMLRIYEDAVAGHHAAAPLHRTRPGVARRSVHRALKTDRAALQSEAPDPSPSPSSGRR